MQDNELSGKIIQAAIEVHQVLGGSGLLESVYESALVHELTLMGLKVERQLAVQIVYKGVCLENTLRLDLLVEDRIIVECKAVNEINPVFMSQLLTYLRLKDLRVGLLINFGSPRVIDGIKRVINGY